MQARVSATGFEARQFGRREINAAGPAPGPPGDASAIGDLFDEAADFVEVVRRLWDSWEDDAEIRDMATGRFIDRDKLHYIDFEGTWFSVRGPSITPRPPQGQPPVSVLAHVPVAFALAARGSATWSSSRRTPPVRPGTSSPRSGSHEEAEARPGPPLRIFADVVVFLDDDGAAARARKDRLDQLYGRVHRSDAFIYAGTPGELADLLLEWRSAGIEGFRLRPGAIPHDLEAITRRLVEVLQDRSAFRRRYEESTLRERLGLPRAINMYAGT